MVEKAVIVELKVCRDYANFNEKWIEKKLIINNNINLV